MELRLFVNRERENLFLARQISARQRGTVMASIPDLSLDFFDMTEKMSTGTKESNQTSKSIGDDLQKTQGSDNDHM